MHTKIKAVIYSVILTGSTGASAADDSTGTVQLTDITVTATRVEAPSLQIPAAVSAVGQDEIQFTRQQLGLQESMANIPGLFFQNAYNFDQELRVSIRGYGSRTNFGIRGIRIYEDGIPLTTPDGQSKVDSIDLGSTQRIEVIRGPSSSLYGSSAGGVINVKSEDGPETPFVSATAAGGSYGFQDYQLKTGGQEGHLNYLVNASRLTLDGYRDHSSQESNNINSKVRYDFDSSTSLTAILNVVDQPFSDDPGALSATQVAANPRQAQQTNIDYNAGESVDQQRVGLILHKNIGDKHDFTFRNYYVWRQFSNSLPSGTRTGKSFFNPTGCPVAFRDLLTNTCEIGNSAMTGFDRFFFGGGGQYVYTDNFFGHRNRLITGFELESQNDDRTRHDNILGTAGALRLDQAEAVNSRSVFFEDEFDLLSHLKLTAGTRYDSIDYSVDDHIGNNSGGQNYDHLSPMVGAVWSPMEWFNLYGNISTAFETPTTTELANPANQGSATGLNPNLKAQTATNYELGIKGLFSRTRVRYEFVVFHIDTRDEFVPVSINGAPAGRSFLENAARTTRDGIEASLMWEPTFVPGLTLTGAYTYSDFYYDEYTRNLGVANPQNLNGKVLPGIPRNLFNGEVQYALPSGWYWAFNMLHADQLYVDSANTSTSPAYTVGTFRVGYSRNFGNCQVSPYLGINNIFGAHYNDNVRINAANGLYFEPAPLRNAYGGLVVRYDF